MDEGLALLSKVAQTGAIEDLLSAGVEARLFTDPEQGEIWDKIVNLTVKYKGALSIGTLREEIAVDHPNFRFEMNSDPTEFILQKFFKSAKRRAAIAALENLADIVDDPHMVEQIDEHFLAAARDVATLIPSGRIARYSDMKDRIRQYHKDQFTGHLPGIPFGIPDIDRVTNGIQPHDYVTIAGWSGMGKSTLGLFTSYNVYVAGYTPMIFSLEMEASALLRKYDALAAHFSTSAMKSLNLSAHEVEQWEKAAERVENARNDIIIIDDVGRCTPERVYSEMVKHKPDLVVVDYVTLMESPRKSDQHWQEVTYITKDLKQTARDLKIPIIGIAQTNAVGDQGFKGSNIAYSKSIVRDSDVLIELQADDEMKAKSQMEVKLVKNRDGRTLNTNLLWEVDTMNFEPWSLIHTFKDRELEASA
jgi:replicative DNA helicase